MPRPLLVALTLAVVAVGVVIGAVFLLPGHVPQPAANPAAVTTSQAAPGGEAGPSPTARTSQPSPQPAPSPPHPYVAATSVGRAWGGGDGLLQFRGNPTHTWYGRGPVPTAPEVTWRYPDRPMCSQSTAGGETKRWCGTGWTGQPAVWRRPDGVTEVVFGAYDGAVHFVDADTGHPTRPPLQTGDLVKGSVTLDPDGYPLLYVGSRDDALRVVALDRDVPEVLWRLEAHPQGIWNDDWDGNASVVDDVMFVGGEDSHLYAVKLNRSYADDGRVAVAPDVLVDLPGWTPGLVERVGDYNMSIENSVAVFEDRVYFANGGGRVAGIDISRVERGEAPVVFDYWVGDDVDASIVVDAEGMLYVAVELERFLPRAREVGQLVKLDPARPDDPAVWGVDVPPRPPPWLEEDDGGIWATPALHAGVLYVTTHPGDLLAVDAASGEVLYREDVGYHEWSSPVVVDETLVIATCEGGGLRGYDVSEPRAPRLEWTATVPGGPCIESTPAVWDGSIYVGARDGFFYALRDPAGG